jgi:hypothetical protein
VREARIHIRHVRDLLKSLDDVDAYSGTECASLAFLNIVTQGDIVGKSPQFLELLQRLRLSRNLKAKKSPSQFNTFSF